MIDVRKQLDQWGPIDGRVLYNSFWFTPISDLIERDYGTPWPEIVGVYEEGRMAFYWERDAMERDATRAIKTWIVPTARRKKLWTRYQLIIERLNQESKRIAAASGRDDESDFSAQALAWYERLMDFWSIASVAELANFGAPLYMRALLGRRVPQEHIDEVLEILLAPTRLSFHQKNEVELLLLAARRPAPQKAWESFVRRWHWVSNSYYESKTLTREDFMNEVRSMDAKERARRIRDAKSYSHRMRSRKIAVARRFDLPRDIVRAADALSYSIWWQDHRKAYAWRINNFTDMLCDYARKKHGMTRNDSMYYTAEDWRDLLVSESVLPARLLHDRQKLVVFDLGLRDKKASRAYTEYAGFRAKEIKEGIIRALSSDDTDVVRGTVVSKGSKRVRGTVRIVHSPREARHMQRGDILVAPMTSPDYITAMRKATAVITDVGGLMSHAAVVSRELGIPCIVGTKSATRVLKDGDRVDVDAETGIVRKMKRSG